MSEQPKQDVLVNVDHAASYLKVSRSTVWRLIRDGKLPSAKVRERNVRIWLSDLEKLAVAR